MEERFKAEVMPVEIASANNGSGRYTFRGVASTIGNVDRMRRVFLPGAWGDKKMKVPLMYNHTDDPVIGSSVLTPKGGKLVHESSLNPKVPKTAEVQALIDDGDIMSTSISWVSDDRYYGWSHLQREAPERAKEVASLGIPKGEDITYFAKATIVENSVVPVPANDQALIGAAGMLGAERGLIESMREVAALSTGQRQLAVGARNSQRDQALLQSTHDAMVELGASCSSNSAQLIEEEGPETEDAAQWSTSFINDLPDSSFLYIEDGGEKDGDGKTTPRSKRHFPYKDASGKVDLPHLRNALARIPQSGLSDSIKADIQAKADRIAKSNGVGSNGQSNLPLSDEFTVLEQELADLKTRF